MCLLTKIKSITPIKLGISFFVIGISLHVIANYTSRFDIKIPSEMKKTFLLNTSWSFAIIFLYPFIVGLTLKYYQEIPRLFEYIFNNLVKDNLVEEDFEETERHIFARFNNQYLFPLTFIITFLLNYMYSLDILTIDYVDWMNKDGIFYLIKDVGLNENGLLPVFTTTGFTLAGLYAITIQFMLVYWVINLVVRGIIFTWSLYYLFNKENVILRLDPLYPDSCFGLKKIGEVGMILNMILFLLGIYISLKVVDKTIIQNLPLTSDIGNPVMLISFVILAPVLFFFPLGAAHHHMKNAKEDFLHSISEKINQLHATLLNEENRHERLECTQSINELVAYLNTMKKNIFVCLLISNLLRHFLLRSLFLFYLP